MEILQSLAATLLQKNQADYIRLQTLSERKAGDEAAFQAETCLRLIIVEDGEITQILGHPVTFFDIHSTKAKQFGFTMEFAPKRRLTCCGDEPYNEAEYPYAKGSEWLLHEAFCLYEQADVFHPYEKHHSTAKDAALLAEQLGVKHLLLYHTEDKIWHGAGSSIRLRRGSSSKERYMCRRIWRAMSLCRVRNRK